MKTLILFILMLIPQYFSTDLKDFIGEDYKVFTQYCEELGHTPRYGHHNGYNFVRIDTDNTSIMCVCDEKEIIAFKIYYDKEHYSLEDIRKIILKDLYHFKDNFYVHPDNPELMYYMGQSEYPEYYCMLIYKHEE
jgi:hypothetical protein